MQNLEEVGLLEEKETFHLNDALQVAETSLSHIGEISILQNSLILHLGNANSTDFAD